MVIVIVWLVVVCNEECWVNDWGVFLFFFCFFVMKICICEEVYIWVFIILVLIYWWCWVVYWMWFIVLKVWGCGWVLFVFKVMEFRWLWWFKVLEEGIFWWVVEFFLVFLCDLVVLRGVGLIFFGLLFWCVCYCFDCMIEILFC